MVVQKPTRRLAGWLKIIRGIVVAAIAVACVCVVIMVFFPDVAAQNIDRLRDIIGDGPVAQLETAVLSVQDQVQKVEYLLGLRKPAAPWVEPLPDSATKQQTPRHLAEIARPLTVSSVPS